MRRVRTPVLSLFALLVSAAVCAAPVADPRGGVAPVAVNGLYVLTFSVKVPVKLPPGATILCKARVAPHTPSLDSFRLSATPEATGQANVIGSTANCLVQLPFSWVIYDMQGGVALSYEIDAVSGAGAFPLAVLRQDGIVAAYPAAGTSANLSFQLTF